MTHSLTLFYTPTSCGAASFISAFKAGLINSKINAVQVDIRSKKVLTGVNAGDDYFKYNPKGNVPCLVLENGVGLNENVAVLSYIAELGKDLDGGDRFVLLNYLSLIATEIHKGIYSPLFTLKSEDAKLDVIAKSKRMMTFIDNELQGGRLYLIGDHFTVADAYLYIVLSWSKFVGLDLLQYPNLTNFYQHNAEVEFIKEAHQAMAEATPKL